ncbi:16S rRNA (cytosine(967)-C(5))-methyltransferase RsmB [Thermodesulfobacteriota bacterium]
MTPRDLAVAALSSSDGSPGFSERFLEREFNKHKDMTERDRAFVVHLVQGVLRWRLRLDWIIEQVLRFPFKKIERPVLDILRTALYQIFYMDRVPDSASVNEAVKQAEHFGREYVTRFINGILREICRRKDSLAFPDREKDKILHLSTCHSFPVWLVEKWIEELGEDEAERLMVKSNQMPVMVIRPNRLRIDRNALIDRLEKEGIRCSPAHHVPEAIQLESSGGAVERLTPFKEGLFQVQSEAAQACSYILSPRPKEAVLDLCAGLGGKTSHMAELMGDEGNIIPLDTNHQRLIRLLMNSRRLGTNHLRPVTADAFHGLPLKPGSIFDRIMVDAPCSALGTISRHPDAKWTRNEKDIVRLAGLQRDILSGAVPFLKRGGRLMYVTCTISREENEMVVNDFLEKHEEIERVDLRQEVPAWGKGLINNEGFFKTFPHIHDMDGFFGALFVKS